MDAGQPTGDRILDAAMALFGQPGDRAAPSAQSNRPPGSPAAAGPTATRLQAGALHRGGGALRHQVRVPGGAAGARRRRTRHLARLAHLAPAGLAAEADLFWLRRPDLLDLAGLVHAQLVQRGHDLAVFSRLPQARGLPVGTWPRWW